MSKFVTKKEFIGAVRERLLYSSWNFQDNWLQRSVISRGLERGELLSCTCETLKKKR
jgi:hypothetical protein